jgi:hypothetical protein
MAHPKNAPIVTAGRQASFAKEILCLFINLQLSGGSKIGLGSGDD